MSCANEKNCACPRDTCPRHGRCCACVKNHRESDSLPFCMFPDNDGDKSMEALYRKLKERFAATTTEANRDQTIQELDEAVKSLDDPNIKWFSTEEAKKMAGLKEGIV